MEITQISYLNWSEAFIMQSIAISSEHPKPQSFNMALTFFHNGL